MRQVVVDTETTGLEVAEGHRIIEVACIELNDRIPTHEVLHYYLNPERKIDSDALKVHGIDSESLESEPKFSVIAKELYEFLIDAELVMHNAQFDLAFLNHEFNLTGAGYEPLENVCEILDTLELARRMRPGRRNNLDALASEYNVDASARQDYHGALLDAEILVGVYRALTGGQTSLHFGDTEGYGISSGDERAQFTEHSSAKVTVLPATDEELALHEEWLDYLDESSDGGSIWRKIESQSSQKNENTKGSRI